MAAETSAVQAPLYNINTLTYMLNKYGPRMTLEETAAVLDLHPQTTRNMLQRGEIEAKRSGVKWIIPTESVAAFLTNPKAEPFPKITPSKLVAGKYPKLIK